jgi:hypothetical protein
MLGAAYWIMKGLTASDAIAGVSEACRATDWVTADRRRVLDDYERVMKISNFDGADFVFHAFTCGPTGRRIGVPLSNLLYWPS